MNTDIENTEVGSGDSEMYVLTPEEATIPLFEMMTMKSMSNAEYASIEDINGTFTGYVIDTEDISVDPIEVWNICKELGNIE